MSRRLLVALSLMVFVLALAYAALQLMLLAPRYLSGAEIQELADRDGSGRSFARAEQLQEEWRRFSWEMGQRPPALERRDQR